MNPADALPLPPSLACKPNIPLAAQTLEQLEQELAYWRAIISAATGWGAGLGAAHGFARACEREIQRRQNP